MDKKPSDNFKNYEWSYEKAHKNILFIVWQKETCLSRAEYEILQKPTRNFHLNSRK